MFKLLASDLAHLEEGFYGTLDKCDLSWDTIASLRKMLC